MKLMQGGIVLAVLCCLALVPQLVTAESPTEKDPNESGNAVPTGDICNDIPDDAYDGTLGSMSCFTIPGPVGIVDGVDLQLGIDHTWVGDLTIKVQSAAGTVLTTMSRPDFDEMVDDGSGCCGDSSDIQSLDPIFFGDSLPNDPEMMGTTILGGEFVCTDDGICDYFANPDSGPGVNFAGFNGEDAAGDWMVCVGDSAAGDTGALCDPVLNISVGAPVPTTGRMVLVILLIALIGASLLVLRRQSVMG